LWSLLIWPERWTWTRQHSLPAIPPNSADRQTSDANLACCNRSQHFRLHDLEADGQDDSFGAPFARSRARTCFETGAEAESWHIPGVRGVSSGSPDARGSSGHATGHAAHPKGHDSRARPPAQEGSTRWVWPCHGRRAHSGAENKPLWAEQTNIRGGRRCDLGASLGAIQNLFCQKPC
jgi:hypothetical protein